jgi:hypothetical protein
VKKITQTNNAALDTVLLTPSLPPISFINCSPGKITYTYIEKIREKYQFVKKNREPLDTHRGGGKPSLMLMFTGLGLPARLNYEDDITLDVVLILYLLIIHLYYVDAAVGTQVGHLAHLTPEIVRNDHVIPKIRR